jgi:hypothetical protein
MTIIRHILRARWNDLTPATQAWAERTHRARCINVDAVIRFQGYRIKPGHLVLFKTKDWKVRL